MQVPFDHPVMGVWTSTYASTGIEGANRYIERKKNALTNALQIIDSLASQNLSCLNPADTALLTAVRGHCAEKVEGQNKRQLRGVTPFSMKREWLHSGFTEAEKTARTTKIGNFSNWIGCLKVLQGKLAKNRVTPSSLSAIIQIFQDSHQKISRKEVFFSERTRPADEFVEPLHTLHITPLKHMGYTGRGVSAVVFEDADPVTHKAFVNRFVGVTMRAPRDVNEDDAGDVGHLMMVSGIIAAKKYKGHEGVGSNISIEVAKTLTALYSTSKLINVACTWRISEKAAIQENVERELRDAVLQHGKPRLMIQSIGNGKEGMGVNISLNQDFSENFFYVKKVEIAERLVLVMNVTLQPNGGIIPFPTSNTPGQSAHAFTLCATGNNIWVPTHRHGEENCFTYANGTSLSTAFVTGAAALLLEAFPDLTVEELRYCLLTGATKIAFNNGASKLVSDEEFAALTQTEKAKSQEHFGCGLLNAHKAFDVAKKVRFLRTIHIRT